MSGTSSVAQTSIGTTAILPASSSTLSTSASVAGTSSHIGACMANPTVTYSTVSYGTGVSSLSYGTGFKAAALAAVPVFFAGAALFGVALLSYAITKAAIEP
ncbi:MAG: hypothetical protein HQK64_00155 [Desulfamplus sp.]|nr:hypothetical protein [Desulfamplus sp.]MBF0388968.1 hypothetical protein [Desulfamplus sp.]